VLLHIALQEGFHHDEVRVSVDAREVWGSADLTTRRQTGYAAAVEVDVAHTPVVVEVVLSKREGGSNQIGFGGSSDLSRCVTHH
jgi:hypothetical protein